MTYVPEKRLVAAIVSAVAFGGLLFPQAVAMPQKAADEVSHPRAVAGYGNIALGFEANRGQAGPGVDALAHGPGYTMLLRQGETVLTLTGGKSSPATSTAQIRMRLAGASQQARFSQENRLETKSNYFLGNDPAQWQTDVPNYARVRYAGVYPGIDLVYYGNRRELEHDFVVAPGADPEQIRIALSGARTVRFDKATGDLVLTTDAGDLRLRKPATYQTVNGRRVDVASDYKLEADGTAGFRLGRYDRAVPLTIDPVLSYSTFMNASSGKVAVDAAGCAYLPSVEYLATSNPNVERTIVALYKVSPGGSGLLYSTFFGGSVDDVGYAVAIDAQGDPYVTGTTKSPDFPVAGGFQMSLKATGSATNAFIAKLNSYGNKIVYASYLGGSSGEVATGIAVDGLGQAYLSGNTSSTDFPTRLPLQATLGGGTDGFVAAVSADGASLRFATYLGGSGTDGTSGIGVDASGNVFVAGNTNSSDFPLHNALQGTLKSGQNGFVTEINAAGTALVYSTYLGGSLIDEVDAMTADSSGNAYIVGSTQSTDFPLANAYQSTGPGGTGYATDGFLNDAVAFATKINAFGSALVYSTYLGNLFEPSWDWMLFTRYNNMDQAYGVVVDSSGDAFLTGYTFDSTFPVTSDAFQPINNGTSPDCGSNAFITEFGPTGGLVYSTYLGSSSGGHDGGGGISLCDAQGSTAAYGIAIDPLASIYISGIAGWPGPVGFPVTAAAYSGNQIRNGLAFLTKFASAPMAGTATTLTSNANPQGAGQSIIFTAVVTTGLGAPETAGEVIFTDNGVQIAQVILNSFGFANYATSKLTEGYHTIRAAYSGHINVDASDASLTEAILTTTAPTFSLPGGTYKSAQTVRINDASSTAVIYFTTDGSNPTTSSTVYTQPIIIASSKTVKAIAQIPTRAASNVVSAAYVILRTTSTPAFSVLPGTYATAKTVTLTDSTSGATIYYTLNGSTPTASSTLYTAPIVVSKSETIKAIAVKTGYNNSAVAAAAYVIETPAYTPVLSVPAGTYPAAKTVIITDGTSGAAIHYTLNGSTPTSSSILYTAPIVVSKSETIKAIAVKTGYLNSAVASAAYVIETPAATPAFSVPAGTYPAAQTVTLTDATSGAAIHYTLNGSTPTSSSTLYTAAVTVSKSETVKAIAVKAGYNNSAVASANYVIQ